MKLFRKSLLFICLFMNFVSVQASEVSNNLEPKFKVLPKEKVIIKEDNSDTEDKDWNDETDKVLKIIKPESTTLRYLEEERPTSLKTPDLNQSEKQIKRSTSLSSFFNKTINDEVRTRRNSEDDQLLHVTAKDNNNPVEKQKRSIFLEELNRRIDNHKREHHEKMLVDKGELNQEDIEPFVPLIIEKNPEDNSSSGSESSNDSIPPQSNNLTGVPTTFESMQKNNQNPHENLEFLKEQKSKFSTKTVATQAQKYQDDLNPKIQEVENINEKEKLAACNKRLATCKELIEDDEKEAEKRREQDYYKDKDDDAFRNNETPKKASIQGTALWGLTTIAWLIKQHLS